MNESQALCPNCHREVVFVQKMFSSQCPECGASYSRSSDMESANSSTVVISLLKAVCWVIIVMVALAGIALAFVFVGCLVTFSR